jgi:hypothetical protein
MWFVVDKVAVGQVFSDIFAFPLVNTIPPWLSIFMYHLDDEQWVR